MFDIYTYLYCANIKTIGPFIMILFYILLSLFAAFVGNVCRLILSLTIKEN